MQRPRPESKESAARTRSFSSTSRVDVIVLTTDTALLATLREAAGGGNKLFHAESPEAAVDLLVGGHCGIFVIDVETLHRDVAELIDKLQSQFPEVVLLATGRRAEQHAVATLVGTGRIYRFLHKPVSPARAELFLSAAIRRYSELRQSDSRSMLGGVSRLTPRAWTIVVTIIVALCAAATVWLWPEPVAPVTRSDAITQTGTPSLEEQIAAIRDRADAAYAAGKLVSPSGESALELYRSILQLDAGDELAAAGVARIVNKLEADVSAALASNNASKARATFATLQSADPSHPRLGAMRSSLVALSRSPSQRPSTSSIATTSPASRTLSAPVAEPAPSNLDLARAYLATDQLIEPLDASALTQLRLAREKAGDESTIQIVATDLGTRLLNRAMAAVESGNIADAKVSYEAALSVDREFETALPDLERVATRISDLQRNATQAESRSLLERAVRLRQSGQLLEPAGDNAIDAFNAARAAEPSSLDVKAEQERLGFTLLENTRTALAAGNIDRADVLAARAEEISPGLPQARALREQIGSARAQREEATTVLQATSVPRRREVAAVYPRDALMNQVQGWVDLEFTISAEGVPSDISVKASDPKRTFDAAATLALRQWRFEPIMRDGTPRTRRAALRMEFKLKN